MDSVITVLVLLLAVIMSSICTRAMPVPVPRPLVQIGLGVLIASVADLSVELRPEIFFLLFLPPLLFLDGWQIPKEGLFKDKGVILGLALGLVFFTVVGGGFLIHWLLPVIPLPVAFALAAVVSPTDPIAVSAIAAKVPFPKRLMHILEGESLLNDAAGLVCMRFAVAAAMTGFFSPLEALGTFVWLAVGGIAVGTAITLAVGWAKAVVAARLGEETGNQILISLLTPFGAYLAAEALECSGILAAVSAGLAMSYVERTYQVLAVTRVRRTVVWDTIQMAATGIIFILLGEQFPRMAAGAAAVVRETGHDNPVWLAVYVVALYLILLALRFGWVWVSLWLMLWQDARHNQQPQRKPRLRLVATTTLAGARGAITLAGVLTLPLTLTDGTPFPARDLAIFLAGGVIIISLLTASFILPGLLRRLELPPDHAHREEEEAARLAAAEAAIHAIGQMQPKPDGPEGHGSDADLLIEASARIMELYRQRIDARSKTGSEAELLQATQSIERQVRLAAIQAERREYFHLERSRKLSDATRRMLVQELDLLETRLLASRDM